MKKFFNVILICIFANIFVEPLHASASNIDSVKVENKLLKKYTRISKTKVNKYGKYYYEVHNKKDNSVGLCNSDGKCIIKPKYYKIHVLDDVVLLTKKQVKKGTVSYPISAISYDGEEKLSAELGYDKYIIHKNVVLLWKVIGTSYFYRLYTSDFLKWEYYNKPLPNSEFKDEFIVLGNKLYDYNLNLILTADRYDRSGFVLSPITKTIWAGSHDYGVDINGRQLYGTSGKYMSDKESAKVYISKHKKKCVSAGKLVGIYQDSTILKIINIATGDTVVHKNFNKVFTDEAGRGVFDVVYDTAYYRYNNYSSLQTQNPSWNRAEIIEGTNYTIVEKGGKKALIGGAFGLIVDYGKYDVIWHLGKTMFWISVNGKIGLFDDGKPKGKKEFIEPKYDGLGLEPTFIKVKLGNKYGAFAWSGEMIADVAYDSIAYDKDLKCYKCLNTDKTLYTAFFKDAKYEGNSYESLMAKISDRKAYDKVQEELAREEAERKAEQLRLERRKREIEETEARRQQEILQEQKRIEKQQALQNLSASLSNLGQAITNISSTGRNSSIVSSGRNNGNTQRYSQNSTVQKLTIPAMKVTVIDNKITDYKAETLLLDRNGDVWLGNKILGKGTRNTGISWGVSSTKYKYFRIEVANQRLQYVHFFNK